MVTARFIVSKVTPQGDPEDPYSYEIEMTPDYSNGRNEDWKTVTPAGVFRLTVDPKKTHAVDVLKKGTHLHIEITTRKEEEVPA